MLLLVWLGFDDNRPTPLTGRTGAFQVWKNVINDINPPSTKKTILPRVKYIWTDLKDGLLSGEACKNSIKVPFIKGTEPTKIPDVRRKCASKKQQSTETILDRLREVFEGGQG